MATTRTVVWIPEPTKQAVGLAHAYDPVFEADTQRVRSIELSSFQYSQESLGKTQKNRWKAK